MVSAQLFKNVLTELKEGDVIVLNMAGDFNDSFKAIYGGWSYDPDNKETQINQGDYTNSVARIQLDEIAAARIWENGLLLQYLTLDKVSVISANGIEGGATSQPVIEEEELWSGSQQIADGWNSWYVDLSVDGKQFNVGDIITVYGKKTTNDSYYKSGACIGEGDNSNSHQYGSEGGINGDVNSEISFQVKTTDEMANVLNQAGSRFILEGKNFDVNKITIMRVGTPARKYTDIVLFDPADYADFAAADGKFGWHQNDSEKSWLGTGIIVEENGEYVYKFYYDWFDAKNTDFAYYKGQGGQEEEDAWKESNYNKQYYYNNTVDMFEQQKNTYPLQLTHENVPEYSKVALGDKIMIDLQCYHAPSDHVASLKEDNGYGSEGQLGAYTTAIDSEDPNKGHESIKMSDGSDFASWDKTDASFRLEFVVDQKLLNYIANNGLVINGRLFKVKKVTARVYSDDDVVIEDKSKTEKDEYYVYTIPADHFKKTPDGKTEDTEGKTIKVEIGSEYEIHITSGKDYHEVIYSYYDNKGVFTGMETKAEAGSWEEAPDLQVSYHIYEKNLGTNVRLHSNAHLTTDHFTGNMGGEVEVANYAPRRAPKEAAPGKVTFAKGVDGGSTRQEQVEGENHYILKFAVGTQDVADAINENGITLRGKGIKYVDKGGVATSVKRVDAEIDFNAPVEIYTVDGVRVGEMEKGNLYIVRQGEKTKKILY